MDTVAALKACFTRLHIDGIEWLRDLDSNDWRRQRYNSNRPHGVKPIEIEKHHQRVVSYVARTGEDLADRHHYIVVRPEAAANDDGWITFLRPVVKQNFDGEPHLNVHVWFHGSKPGAQPDELTMGWRLEGPEGRTTAHNFFHAQPLCHFGPEGAVTGLPAWLPSRFPTFPISASSSVDIVLSATLLACGKAGLDLLINGPERELRERARTFRDHLMGAP